MPPGPKQALLTALRNGREAALWKLEGLSEYDARRPLTPTGSSVLGILKHLAFVEGEYLGSVFGRPLAALPGLTDAELDADPHADLVARPDETREEIVERYRLVAEHSEQTCAVLSLDDLGHVPWWPQERAGVTLQQVLVHLVAETHRHTGQLDILREGLDGAVGMRADAPNQPDAVDWPAHVARVERAAREAAEAAGER